MSLESQIAALVQASNNLTSAVNGKIGEIDKEMDTALAQFEEWRNLKDVIGNPTGFGTMRMNILQGHIYGTGGTQGANVSDEGSFQVTDLGSSENVYIHFKVPLNVNIHSEMFWFNVKGYSYGTSKIIDETIVGYCYSPLRDITSKSSFGNMTPDVYKDSNGNVVLRLLIPSIYYTTIRVDTMRVGNGRLFNIGDLKTKLSLSQTVVFS